MITPGTPFMDKLGKYLRIFIQRKLTFDPGWKDIKVILSDAAAPGEATIQQKHSVSGASPDICF